MDDVLGTQAFAGQADVVLRFMDDADKDPYIRRRIRKDGGGQVPQQSEGWVVHQVRSGDSLTTYLFIHTHTPFRGVVCVYK